MESLGTMLAMRYIGIGGIRVITARVRHGQAKAKVEPKFGVSGENANK